MAINAFKVVSAKQMQELEAQSVKEGANAANYMLKAGEGIANAVMEFVEINEYLPRVSLLIGKGNNGGDALVAGMHLLKKSYDIKAFCIANPKDCSELNHLHAEEFQKLGGQLQVITQIKDFKPLDKSILLDGLLGTGFDGQVSGLLAEMIQKANKSALPTISIDIPSGLSGNTGKVGGIAIKADLTLFLGLPKIGFFICDGIDFIGNLSYIDFGIDPNYIEKIKPLAFYQTEASIKQLLPPIKRSRHKYEAGYVICIAGSKGMSGAAILSAKAALRAGAGIVRVFFQKELDPKLLENAEEVIAESYSLQAFEKQMKRAKAFVIGPGIGRSESAKQTLQEVLPLLSAPTCVDADALYFFNEVNHQQANVPLVLTPHKGELYNLLKDKNLEGMDLIHKTQTFCNENNVTLILKGAPTMVFHPKVEPQILICGTPGMATAGSGDVLSGIIAASLASEINPQDAAVLGVFIHGLAGEIATIEKTNYSLIASDIIKAIPDAFCEIT